MMDEIVPVVKSVHRVYTQKDSAAQQIRLDALISRFSSVFDRKPDFIARSPGRVNIIGEHIDYSLYEVLPMAIAADVLIAVTALPSKGSSAKITVANMDPKRFPSIDFEIPLQGQVSIDASTLQWSNYFKAGLHGARVLLAKDDSAFRYCTMQVLIDGNVPAGSGLSSSAAFVCASTLAVLRANGYSQISKKALVEQAIISEREVGVNSGGMDQAASVFSVQGTAVSVSFQPELHAEAIAFPDLTPPITFMIAQSFVAADKHLTGPKCYNLRVVECTLAAKILAAIAGIDVPEDTSPLGCSLFGFQEAFFAAKQERQGLSPELKLTHLLDMLEIHLDQSEGYTREDIARALNISVADLESHYMSKFPVQADRFMLKQRAQHVFSEARRVIEFKHLLIGDSQEAELLLPQLGALMNATQASCRDLYDCSCPELDRLCEIALEAGAYGSRLTGAGWGGCTVHLVPKDKVSSIRKAWDDKYYKKRDASISSTTLNEAVIVSEPGHGSMIIDLT